MATEDITNTQPTDVSNAEVGKSDNTAITPEVVKTPEDLRMEKLALLPDPTSLDDDRLSDADKAMETKANPKASSDFYQRFLDKQEQAEFAADLQSSETYWNNRPEERKKYEDQYGVTARDEFNKEYAKIEDLWRKKLETETEKVVMNQRYDWLFGKGPNIDYDNEPTFEVVNEIYNGARRIDTLLTDKTMSDREAAVNTKRYMNDKGELVQLSDNEKWYSWSRGTGVEMNGDDPKHRSADGRKITGFEYVPFDPEMRSPAYVKALYEGDFTKGELMSMWDTTNNWLMKSNKKTAGSVFAMLPKTAVRTVTNITADMITGTTSLLNSFANWFDTDDSGNAFIDTMNDISTVVKSRKMSLSEYDQSKMITTSNAIDFVAQVASQLYVGVGLYKGVNGLTKVLLARNPLLQEAKALEKAGKFLESGRKVAEFEQKYGFAARSASLVGLTLATGDQVVTEARAAGFNEDEVASIYIAYFGAMLGANTITNRMIEPYLTDAAAAPLMKDIVRKTVPTFAGAVDDKAKISLAKRMVTKMTDAVTKLPRLGAEAGHGAKATASPITWLTKDFMVRGLNEAIEEEAEWFGQEIVELGATMINARAHKGEKEVPKFDTIFEEGYWSRQLPNIVMSGLGGFMGGAMTHFLPGFGHQNEESHLLKGEDADRLLRIAVMGGKDEQRLFAQMEKDKKSGAMGSTLLSVKMDDTTGKFYKMTDSEAQGTISHAEAAHRAIMNQYLYYKTLYGDGSHTYDAIIKADPTLATELKANAGHVFHGQITDLHKQKSAIIQSFLKDSKTPVPEAEPKPPKVTEDPTIEDTSKNPGVTAEPVKEDPNSLKDYNKELADKVVKRAAVFNTKEYGQIKTLLEIEDKIDDILSGRAADQQVVKSIIRSKKIGAFMKDYQDKLFGTVMAADGTVGPSEFTKFGDSLLEGIFSADTNFADLHTQRHGDYLRDSKIVSDKINPGISIEDLQSLATAAHKNPKSIAIDKDSTTVSKLTDGVNKLLEGLIGAKDLRLLIDKARIDLRLVDPSTGLARDTQWYQDQIFEKITDAQDEGLLVDMSKDEIVAFVGANLDILYEGALSQYIDRLTEKPSEFLVNRLNLNKGEFKDKFIANLVDIQNLTIAGKEGDAAADIVAAQTKLNTLQSSLDGLIIAEPKTSAEKVAKERQIAALRNEIALAKMDLAKANRDFGMEGSLDAIMTNVGANTIAEINRESIQTDLTPLVKESSDKVTQAQTVIDNFKTVINNIAPIVPTVPKLGAVYNFLNEVSIDGNSLVITPNRIISEEDEEKSFSTNEYGETIRSEAPPTVIEQLYNNILYTGLNVGTYSEDIDYSAGKTVRQGEYVYTSQGPVPAGTPLTNTQYWKLEEGEFRNLEDAKHLLGAIRIRMAQVETVAAVMDKLAVLRIYSKKHIPTGKNRYDQLPRFMAEHVLDPERLAYLQSKNVLTKEEETDLTEMLYRAELLTNFENPSSVMKRLKRAEELTQRLVDLGNKSLSMEERYRVYTSEAARNLNMFRSNLERETILDGRTPELDAAIAKFKAVADNYKDTDAEKLVAGKEALDEVLNQVYTIPVESKRAILDVISEYSDQGSAKHYMWNAIVESMATYHGKFEQHYNEVLSELSKVPGFVSPTISQENMVRAVFSFLTDKTGAFKMLPKNKNMWSLFVDGGNGTGKSTMIGLGIAAAQRYNNKKVIDAKGKDMKAGEVFNKVAFASLTPARAQNVRDLALKVGVDKESNAIYTKKELYNFLNDDKSNTDELSFIVFDEATFIQGEANEGNSESELDWFTNKIDSLNRTRKSKNLPELKLLLIGDNGQGGWMEGMPTMFDNATADTIDYNSTKRSTPVDSHIPHEVMKTTKLTYPFRTLCSKVTEVVAKIKSIRENLYSPLTGKTIITKLVVSSGVIGNDKVRGRMGGVNVVRSREDLYNDKDLIANITKQLKADPKFKVLIVDDAIIDGITPSAELNALISNYKDNFEIRTFEFCTITQAQGGEADYVLADTTSIFPKLPLKGINSEGYKLDRLSMVISRARLFAKITANKDVHIENAEKAVIKMLEDDKAAELTKIWNDFYLIKYRKVTDKVEAKAPEQVPKAPKTEAEPNMTVDETPVPPITEQEVVDNVSTEMRYEPVDLSISTPIRVNKFVTKEVVDELKKEAQQVLDNPAATTEAKSIAKQTLETAESTIVELIQLVETEPIDSIDESAPDAIETKAKLTKIKDKAKEEMLNLEELGFLFSYFKIKDSMPIEDQLMERLYFANDLFGFDDHKGKEQKALEEIKRTIELFSQVDENNRELIKDYKLSLVSFQLFDRNTNTAQEIIEHQLYAKRHDSNVRTLLARFPEGSIDKNGVAGQFFKGRAETILSAHKILDALAHNDEIHKSTFVNAQTRRSELGPIGIAMSNSTIDKINKLYQGKFSDKNIFPSNTSNTKFGRTSLSDQPRWYQEKGKMSPRNMDSGAGQLFMETTIAKDDIFKVIQATTPGAPLRGTLDSRAKLSAILSRKEGSALDPNVVASMPIGQFLGEKQSVLPNIVDAQAAANLKVTKTTAAVANSLSGVLELVDGKPITKFDKFTILTFKGMNGRRITLSSKNQEPFQLTFGFRQGPVAIEAITPKTEVHKDITADLEVQAIVKQLGSNSILDSEAAGIMTVIPSIDAVNSLFANYNIYDQAKAAAITNSDDQLTYMAKSFMERRIISFSDLQIPLQDFKDLMQISGVQISPVFTYTKTTKDNKQGKSFLLYTYNSKHNLSDIKFVEQTLSRLKVFKASQMNSKTFNAKMFAKHGIGIIMLDNKMQTISGLLSHLRSKSYKDMNRSSSPIGSATNKRMISFVKELTQLVHKVDGLPVPMHNNLSKMAMTQGFDTIFSGKNMTELETTLRNMKKSEEDRFNILNTFLTHITNDANLGYQVVDVTGEPELVINFLELTDTKDRVNYYNDNFTEEKLEGETDESRAQIEASLAKFGITSKDLFGKAAGKEGRVQAGIVYDKTTGRPIVINNVRNAITFIDPALYSGAEAVFNMAHFIEQIDTISGKLPIPGLSGDATADVLASTIDSIMQNYSDPNTIRKGVMWTGRLTTTLASSLGVAKSVDENMFTTSVKEINPPAFIISIKNLINATKEKAPLSKAEPDPGKTNDEIVTTIREDAMEMLQAEVDKLGIMPTIEEVKSARKTVMQNIATLFFGKEKFFNPGKDTIMKTEILNEFDKLTKDMVPSPDEIRKKQEFDEVRNAATDPAGQTVEEVSTEILEGIAAVIANQVVGNKYRAIEVLREQILNNEVLNAEPGKVKQTELLSRLDEHLAALGPEVRNIPAGEKLIDSLKPKPLSQNEAKVLVNLFSVIDQGTIPIKNIDGAPALEMLISNLEEFNDLQPDAQKDIVKKASALQMELLTIAEETLNYSATQLNDLDNAFRKLTYKC